ncbi:hypothetical protein MTO96_051089 [Rhipicephalus appendiculatus]
MRAPRVCLLLLLVVLLSANFIEALSYQLEQPREFQDESGRHRPGRRYAFWRMEGLDLACKGSSVEWIHEIEIVIDLGRKFEKNLTTMRELVNKEMEKSRSRHEIMVCKKRIAGIDKILTQVHTRNDQTEARFRTLLKRILSGEIRSKQRSRVLLQGLLTGYRTSLHSLFRNSSGFLRSIVQGVSGALSHLGMGILDIFRLKFQPFKFAINAITNGGSFRRPISSVLFGR